MKKSILGVVFIASILKSVTVLGQIQVKTDYLSNSYLKDKIGGNFGDGDLTRVSARYTTPLSVKIDSVKGPTSWILSAGGSYAKLNNNVNNQIVPNEIINASANITYVRPFSLNWYIAASLGAGIYAQPDEITTKSILMNGSVFLIYKFNDNLDVGLGGAITSSYGVPMFMPAGYIKWKTSGKYEFNFNASGNIEVSASRIFSDRFKLKVVGMEFDGLSAVMNVEGSSKIYSSMFMKSYLSPELKLGKEWTLNAGIGASWLRTSRLQDRTLQSFWNNFKNSDLDERTNFKRAAYFTIGLKYNL